MKKSNLCGKPDADENDETGKQEKKIEQELSTLGDVPTNLTISASRDSGSSKRKSEDSSPTSSEKKVNPGSKLSSDYDPEPSCSGLQQQKQQERQEDQEPSDEKKSTNSSRKRRRRSGRRPAWLIALDDSNCHVFTRAVVNRITDIRSFGYSSTTAVPSRDENNFEQNPADGATDDTIEGIVIKNLIDFNELDSETDSDSGSDSSSTSGSSVSTTITVISANSIVQGISTSDFEQLTVIEDKPGMNDETRPAGQRSELVPSSSTSPPSSALSLLRQTSTNMTSTATAIAAAVVDSLSKLNSTFFLHDIAEEIEFDEEIEIINVTEVETEPEDENEDED